MRRNTVLVIAVSVLVLFNACTPSPKSLKRKLEKNPDILFNAIEKNPDKFLKSMKQAATDRRKRAPQRPSRSELERAREFRNPKQPKIDGRRAFFGNKDAPITIVHYSDFESPQSAAGNRAVKKVMLRYQGKVHLLYKHVPQSHHKMAVPAAKYFEAVALQSHKKAIKFHDTLFENQSRLTANKEGYLKEVSRGLGVNMAKLGKDLKSKRIRDLIEEDAIEAKSFGLRATPSFLINGITLQRTVNPLEFEKIIERILASQKP